MTTPDERLEAARVEGRKRLRAGIYTRMSVARLDDNTKVEDQKRISEELCERRGWDVADVYCDNNRSAWQRDRKRKHWDRMLEDIKAGRLDAIVVYHGDRLIRQPEDLVTLLKLADAKGIKLASPTGTRDLDSPDDQFILEIEASMAKRESWNTSRRKKAQFERMRRQGLVRSGGRGGRAFGFDTDGVTHLAACRCDVATRQLLSEPDVVREMAARILAGESVGAIARDVSARGWRTPAGRPFTHGTIRKMLSRPRYTGLMPDGRSAAAWEPVLERETWEAVCAVLAAKADGFGYATNARRYMLSGIALCGTPGCGAPMRVRDGNGYECTRPGCRKAYRSVKLLDAYVSRRVVHLLNNPLNPEGHLMTGTALATEYQILQKRRREASEAIADPSHGDLPELLARLDRIDTRLAELRELAASDARTRLLTTHAGITAEEFAGLPLATRRALVAACYRVVVLPASRRGPGFRTEDVELTLR